MDLSELTSRLKQRAGRLGFDLVGVCPAVEPPGAERFAEWLARGYAGEMKYLADPRRSNPQSVMSGLRTVIVCALNYNSSAPRSRDALNPDGTEPRGWISRYAWGEDYHDVLKQKLQELIPVNPLGESLDDILLTEKVAHLWNGPQMR